MSNKSKKKKRGRKNIGHIIDYKNLNNKDSSICSEEEPIIVHLPISSVDIDLSDSDNLISSEYQSSKLFIKNEKDIDNTPISSNQTSISYNLPKGKKLSKKDKLIWKYEEEIKELKQKLHFLEIDDGKCKVSYSNYSQLTKCWWCRNNFDTLAISLPEDYFQEKFICMGHFCSFNCALSYNLELNDQKTWKRKSLLFLLYKKTYNKYIQIYPAPSWRTLIEYGGNLTIEKFRENLLMNNTEYLYLHPPLTTRFSSIEKTNREKNNKNVPVNKIGHILKSEYALKRQKPLKSTRYSLEDTMGLRRKKKKNIKV